MADIQFQDSRIANLYPIGTRIRSVAYPTTLTGTIIRHEYTDHGYLSALPYRIKWDNDHVAQALLGGLYFWRAADAVTAIPPDQPEPDQAT